MHRTKGRVRTGSKACSGAVKICRHFLLGQCTYGSRCRYSHTAVHDSLPSMCKGTGKGKGKGEGTGQVKRALRQHRHLGKATPPRGKAGTAGKGAPVKGRVRNNNTFPNASVCVKANNGARTCLHYRRGWCAYGDACRFTHPQEKEDAAAAVAASAAAKAAEDGSGGLQLVLRLPSELWMEVLCFHSLLELVTTTICKVRGARGGARRWWCGVRCVALALCGLRVWGKQFHVLCTQYQWTVTAVRLHRITAAVDDHGPIA